MPRYPKKNTATIFAMCMIGLSGCTTVVDLRYKSDSDKTLENGTNSIVSIGSFIDLREEEADWLGAIRSSVGIPIDRLKTSMPVQHIVEKALADGLTARKFIISPDAAIKVSGSIIKFEYDQYLNRMVAIDLTIAVTEDNTGNIHFSKTYSTKYKELALSSSKDRAAEITEEALRKVIDSALEDHALRRHLSRKSGTDQSTLPAQPRTISADTQSQSKANSGS